MIWQLEVDTALLDKLKTIYKDTTVKFSMPHIGVAKAKFPCVTITPLDPSYKYNFKDSNSRIIEKDFDKGVSYTRETPEYVNLVYQIDMWAKTPQDLNKLTSNWVVNIPRRSTLNLVGTEGETYLALVYQDEQGRALDSHTGEDTTFRRSYTISITIPIDNSPKFKSRIALAREINYFRR